MSKNISIQEGGVGRAFSADRLKTALSDGGSCYWVPEDDVSLITKHITQNGTYNAADDDVYGYSQVTVSGVGVTSGKYPDSSGDDAYARVDPSTGKITIERLPSRIEVTTPPGNPYDVYQDGQTIDPTGMVVTAYTASGDVWGTVPLAEILMEPTAAHYDAATDSGGYTDDQGVEATAFVSATVPYRPGSSFYDVTEGFMITQPDAHFMLTRYNGYLYGCSTDENNYGFGVSMHFTAADGHSGALATSFNVGQSFDRVLDDRDWVFYVAESTVDPTGVPRTGMRFEPLGSRQTITVTWPRPGDGQELTATFSIRVAPPYSDGSEEGGNATPVF